MDTKEKKYSFRLKTHEGHTLKMLFEVLNHIIKTNCTLELSDGGIDISLMDDEKRSIFHGVLDKDKFNSYYIEKPMNITLDLSTTIRMMKHIKKKDTLFITRYRDKENQLEFKVKTDNKSKSEHVSYISISDTIMLKKIVFPDNYGKCISISSGEFYKNCKSICSAGNLIQVKSDRLNKLEFYCEENSTLNKKVLFHDSDSESEDSKNPDFYDHKFPSSYVLKIAKLVNLTPKNDIKVYIRDKMNKVNDDLGLCIKLNIGNLGMAEFQLLSEEQFEDLRLDDDEDESDN